MINLYSSLFQKEFCFVYAMWYDVNWQIKSTCDSCIYPWDFFVFLFVLGLTFSNIWGHIMTVPARSSDTLTNVLPHRHITWQPTPSQYKDTGSTCRCSIHWCGTSHWNTHLPILMSWVRPDRKILPWPSTHTSKCSTWYCYGSNHSEAW